LFYSLHNHSTRSHSLDLRVVNVPKLLCTTHQLKEQTKQINEQQQITRLPSNGNLCCSSSNNDEKQNIRSRINELEQELNLLKSQLIPTSTAYNS
jgi:hypothetical protein